jgi:hypothetical protein
MKGSGIVGSIHVREPPAVVKVQHNIAQLEPCFAVYADIDRLVAIRRLSHRDRIGFAVELLGLVVRQALGRGTPAVEKGYIRACGISI